MRIGLIVGTLTCSEHSAGMTGVPLVQVRILGAGDDPGELIAACNATTAGAGECVLVADGSAARLALGAPEAPVDAAVVAIVDGGAEALR